MDEEDEEMELVRLRGIPPSAARAGRDVRGCGTGNGLGSFGFRWQKEKQNIRKAWNFQQANPRPTKRRRTTITTIAMTKYLLLKNSMMPKGLG